MGHHIAGIYLVAGMAWNAVEIYSSDDAVVRVMFRDLSPRKAILVVLVIAVFWPVFVIPFTINRIFFDKRNREK